MRSAMAAPAPADGHEGTGKRIVLGGEVHERDTSGKVDMVDKESATGDNATDAEAAKIGNDAGAEGHASNKGIMTGGADTAHSGGTVDDGALSEEDGCVPVSPWRRGRRCMVLEVVQATYQTRCGGEDEDLWAGPFEEKVEGYARVAFGSPLLPHRSRLRHGRPGPRTMNRRKERW